MNKKISIGRREPHVRDKLGRQSSRQVSLEVKKKARLRSAEISGEQTLTALTNPTLNPANPVVHVLVSTAHMEYSRGDIRVL